MNKVPTRTKITTTKTTTTTTTKIENYNTTLRATTTMSMTTTTTTTTTTTSTTIPPTTSTITTTTTKTPTTTPSTTATTTTSTIGDEQNYIQYSFQDGCEEARCDQVSDCRSKVEYELVRGIESLPLHYTVQEIDVIRARREPVENTEGQSVLLDDMFSMRRRNQRGSSR